MGFKRKLKKRVLIVVLFVVIILINSSFTNVHAEENYVITLMSQLPRIINGYDFGQVQGSCMTKNWYVIATEKDYANTNDNTNEFILCEKGDANGNGTPFEHLQYISLYNLNHVNALTYNPNENKVVISYSTYLGEPKVHFLYEEGDTFVDGGDFDSAIYAFAIGYNQSDNTYYAIRTVDSNSGERCIIKYSNDFSTYEDLYRINTGSLVVQDCFCRDKYLYLCCTEDADANNNRINNSIKIFNLRNGEFVKNLYIPNPENDNATKEEIESGDFYGDDMILSYDTVIKENNGKHTKYRSVFLVSDLNRDIDLVESEVPAVIDNALSVEENYLAAADQLGQSVGAIDNIQNENTDSNGINNDIMGNLNLTINEDNILAVGSSSNLQSVSDTLSATDNQPIYNVGQVNNMQDETVANIILPKTGDNRVIYLIVIFVALINLTWCYIRFRTGGKQ